MAKATPDYDEILRKIVEATAPQADYSKGLTTQEYAEQWGVAEGTARRRINRGLKNGVLIKSVDYRPGTFRPYRVVVYRKA